MKYFSIAIVAMALSGCEAVRAVAPQTTAGFETGGLLGALDGASGAILARCRTLDGTLIRVAVDDVAVATGASDLVGNVRQARMRACERAGQVQAFIDEPFEGDAEEIPILSVGAEGAIGQNTDTNAEKPASE